MALPIIVAPEYTTNLPSNGLEVKYRPFLVKEEKLLLFAAESGEKDDMINSVCQMMNNCVISPELDPHILPYFDFEYLFLHIRAKSVGETAEFKLKHDKEDKNLAMLLSEITYNPELPVPIGILYQETKSTYDDMMTNQIEEAKQKNEPDLEKLFSGTNSWVVD